MVHCDSATHLDPRAQCSGSQRINTHDTPSGPLNVAEVRERFDYLMETRTRFLEVFRGLGWEAFTKDRGATWGSMLGIFIHILDVEEGWLQYAARRGSTLDAPDRKVANYHDFDQLAADNSKVGELTRE